WMTDADRALINSDDPLDFLGLAAFAAAPLRGNADFEKKYLEMVSSIDEKGAKRTLQDILK
ncbi:MAG: mannitol dehydrogenase family protein, partial [Desulfovibrio sp.]|nr:mannitol dehydrogenase family protein [Desulfovibrio sp.]